MFFNLNTDVSESVTMMCISYAMCLSKRFLKALFGIFLNKQECYPPQIDVVLLHWSQTNVLEYEGISFPVTQLQSHVFEHFESINISESFSVMNDLYFLPMWSFKIELSTALSEAFPC